MICGELEARCNDRAVQHYCSVVGSPPTGNVSHTPHSCLYLMLVFHSSTLTCSFVHATNGRLAGVHPMSPVPCPYSATASSDVHLLDRSIRPTLCPSLSPLVPICPYVPKCKQAQGRIRVASSCCSPLWNEFSSCPHPCPYVHESSAS